MAGKEALLADVVEGLKVKDDRIYEEIFNTSAPNMDQFSSLEFLMALDSIPDTDIVSHSAGRLDKLEVSAGRVEENFKRVMEAISASDFVMPPMSNPLKDFTFAQTGASIGDKINPFYKVPMKHNGLDLIAPAGDPVCVLWRTERSRKSSGRARDWVMWW